MWFRRGESEDIFVRTTEGSGIEIYLEALYIISSA
jgi:hypothetical protein